MEGFGDKTMEVWRRSQSKFYGEVLVQPLPNHILDLVSVLHWEEVFEQKPNE